MEAGTAAKPNPFLCSPGLLLLLIKWSAHGIMSYYIFDADCKETGKLTMVTRLCHLAGPGALRWPLVSAARSAAPRPRCSAHPSRSRLPFVPRCHPATAGVKPPCCLHAWETFLGQPALVCVGEFVCPVWCAPRCCLLQARCVSPLKSIECETIAELSVLW